MKQKTLTLLLALMASVTGLKAQSDTPLTLEAIEAGTVTIKNPKEITTFYYQKNNSGASTPVNNTAMMMNNVTTISLSKGDKLTLYGINPQYGDRNLGNSTNIICSADCYIYGNIMSIINMNEYKFQTVLNYDFAFANLFNGNALNGNAHIKNHPSKALVLPATTLTKGCYYYMFGSCSGLTTAPDLPATTMVECCYQYMFRFCSKLTTAPRLPAMTLAANCYTEMFTGCTNLTAAPSLPATELAVGCYESMFYGCSKLATAPDLPATTLATGCYLSMFHNCKDLTKVPFTLPATILTQRCYAQMFYGCTSLKTAPNLPAMTLADGCYWNMFSNTGLTKAPALPATTLTSQCYYGMFSGCTDLTQSPNLPATILASQCYSSMFYGCSKLNWVRCMALQLGDDYASNWLLDVPSTGTFVTNTSVSESALGRGVNAIPNGWTVINDATSPESIRYDANNDGKVDAADVVIIVDYIMHNGSVK